MVEERWRARTIKMPRVAYTAAREGMLQGPGVRTRSVLWVGHATGRRRRRWRRKTALHDRIQSAKKRVVAVYKKSTAGGWEE